MLLTRMYYLLILSLSTIGIDGQATDLCLSCIMRHKPVDDCETYDANRVFCGPYRISNLYFQECMADPSVTDKNFETCTTDIDCSTACVKAYQSEHAESCLGHRQTIEGDDYQELTCADYGRMHYGGPSACAREDTDEITHYLANLTSLCGCLTVCGTCEDTAADGKGGVPNDLLLIYIIAPICAAAVIVTLICCIYQIRKYHRQSQRPRDNGVTEEMQAGINKGKRKKEENGMVRNDYSLRTETTPQPAIPRPPFPLPSSNPNSLQQEVMDPQYDKAVSVDTVSTPGDLTPSVSSEQLSSNQQPAHMYENSKFLFQAHKNTSDKSPRHPLPLPRHKTLAASAET